MTTNRDTIVYKIDNILKKDCADKARLKNLVNHVIDTLDDYNKFLLSENYTDCDVLCEEPTALDEYLLNVDKSK